jgi:hypothetical protein
MTSFAHLWKADKLSDVDVAIRVDGSPDDILVMPAHQAILSSSPYFWAQVRPLTEPMSLLQQLYSSCCNHCIQLAEDLGPSDTCSVPVHCSLSSSKRD